MHWVFQFPTEIYAIRISIFERYIPGTIVSGKWLTKCWQKPWSGPPQVYQNITRIFTSLLAICKFKTNIIRFRT